MAGNPDTTTFRKVLIIRWGALGDLALCSAVLEDLNNAMPQAEFHLLVEKHWAGLFRADPRISRLLTFPMRGVSLWQAFGNWWQVIASGDYDLVIDFQSNDRSRLLMAATWLAGKAPRWRLSTRSVFPYNLDSGSADSEAHALQVFRRVLVPLGIQAQTTSPVLHVAESSRQHARQLLDQHQLLHGQFAAFVPGSSDSGKAKRWGTENYARLARLMLDQGMVQQVVLLGGPGEQQQCQQIIALAGDGVSSLAGKTALDELTTIMGAALAVVANDTGLAHIASAACRQVVVICGPTRASRVRPAGEQVIALQADPGCFDRHPASECMSQITPQMVLHALQAGSSQSSSDISHQP